MNTLNFEEELISMIPRLKSFALKLTNNKEDSEDLLNETMFLSLKNKSKYTDNTNFKGWVYTIMRNCFINDYRRSIKFGRTLEYNDIKADSISIEGEIDNKLQLNQIIEFMNKQNDKLSTPMILYSQGYKYEEISEMIGCPMGTIKSRIFIMREKLIAIS